MAAELGCVAMATMADVERAVEERFGTSQTAIDSIRTAAAQQQDVLTGMLEQHRALQAEHRA